jgi:uncharacterized repeat protein (TIGR01451 family)
VPAGSSAPTLTIAVTAPTAGVTLIDTATVSGPLPDPVSANNTDAASTRVLGPADTGISGTVFADADGDNVPDPGEALSGVTVSMTGTDDLGAAVTASTVTGPDGAYLFAGLRPGTYTVHETQPPAYADGRDTVGSAGGTLTNDTVSAITLTGGTLGTGYLFAETPGSIGDLVYDDRNGNGVRDPGEPGIAGVEVTLTGPGGATSTTTTAADGSYAFTGLPAGAYTVTAATPAGSSLTTGNVPDAVTLAPGQALTDADFGFHTPAADLRVTVDAPPTAPPGSRVPVTVTVSNRGPDPATSVTTTITVPAGTTLLSAVGSGWTCTLTGPTAATCSRPALGAGATAPPITVTITKPTAGTVPITATTTSDLPDPVLGDNTDSDTVRLPANRPPHAADDHGSTVAGTPVTLTVTGNDTDPDGDSLTITRSTDGAHGSVSCTATTCTYTPVDGFTGTDTYTYAVSDGHGHTATAAVTITVTPVLPVTGSPVRDMLLVGALAMVAGFLLSLAGRRRLRSGT